MLFAESSDAVIVVTAICSLIGTIFSGVMAYYMTKLKEQQTVAAVKAEHVENRLEKVNQATEKRFDSIDNKVEEIHKATNSMKDALILSTETEALARGKAAGIKEEKERER